uniref:Protein HIRA n=1 Tax=Arcella intermedia TaxID=1963864 RepID=A0A6B2KXA8_9EUKA
MEESKRDNIINLEAPPPTGECLATLSCHASPVNCVRWSKNGKYLASCSDDKQVIIWEISPIAQRPPLGHKPNIQNWQPILHFEHSKDVVDLCWDPDSRYVASCSIDNTIIVWDITKDKNHAKVKILTGHKGYVKGVAWDPIGRYIASQADDKSLIIWRWPEGTILTDIIEPFKTSTSNVFFKRLSWSPDGSYLCTACGYKKECHISPVFHRNEWTNNKSFVGHSTPVVCTQWNPIVFRKTDPKENGEKTEEMFCCALASQDGTISIWATGTPRAVVIIKKLFYQSVLDLSWSPDGHNLLMCSGDGTVAICHFPKNLLGEPLSAEELKQKITALYGNMDINNGLLAEDPGVLKMQEDFLRKSDKNQESAGRDKENQEDKEKPEHSEEDSIHDASDKSEEDPDNDEPTRKPPRRRSLISQITTPTGTITQTITHLPGGKKQIIPQFIGGLGTSTSTPESRLEVTQSPSNEPTAKGNQETLPTSTALSATTSAYPVALPSLGTSTTPILIEVSPSTLSSSLPSVNTLSGSLTSMSGSAAGPVIVSRSGAPITLQAVSGNTTTSVTATPVTTVVPSLTSSKPTLAATINRDNLKKRKRAFTETEKPPKKKKKIIDNFVLRAEAGSVSPQEPDKVTKKWIIDCPKLSDNMLREFKIRAMSGLELDKTFTIEIKHDKGVSRIQCMKDNKPHWQDLIQCKVTFTVACKNFFSIGGLNGDIYIYNTVGRRLFPCIMMGPSPIGWLSCDKEGQHLLAINCNGKLNIWNIVEQKHVLKASLEPLLESLTLGFIAADIVHLSTATTVTLITGAQEAFMFDPLLKAWSRLADATFPLSEFSSSLLPTWSLSRGPLLELQSRSSGLKDSSLARALKATRSSEAERYATNVAFIEQQLAASEMMNSVEEWKRWASLYVEHLAKGNFEEKLEHFCDEMLVCCEEEVSTAKDRILGVPKVALLRELLPIISMQANQQRLVTRLHDSLKRIKPNQT